VGGAKVDGKDKTTKQDPSVSPVASKGENVSTPTTSSSSSSSSTSAAAPSPKGLNPNAKAFTLNATAAEFKPSGSVVAPPRPQQQQQLHSPGQAGMVGYPPGGVYMQQSHQGMHLHQQVPQQHMIMQHALQQIIYDNEGNQLVSMYPPAGNYYPPPMHQMGMPVGAPMLMINQNGMPVHAQQMAPMMGGFAPPQIGQTPPNMFPPSHIHPPPPNSPQMTLSQGQQHPYAMYAQPDGRVVAGGMAGRGGGGGVLPTSAGRGMTGRGSSPAGARIVNQQPPSQQQRQQLQQQQQQQ